MFGQRIGMTAKEVENYNFAELIDCMSLGRMMGPGLSPELKKRQAFYRDCTRAIELMTGRQTGSLSSMIIPPDVLENQHRSMSASPGAKGGYLVGTETPDFVSSLRARSVAANLPFKRLPRLVSNLTMPRAKTTATTGWLAPGGTIVAADSSSGLQLGQLSMTPRTVSAMLDISIPLLRGMGQGAHDYIVTEGGAAMALSYDAAILNGPGGEQPTGVLRTPNVGNQVGAALAWSGVADMLKSIELAGDMPASTTAWVVAPDTAKLLRTRERAAGSGFILDNDMIANRPALVSGSAPAGSLTVADWSRIYLGEWGSGLEVEVSGSGPTRFDVGIISIRFLWFVDVAVQHPTAISKAESIT